MYFNDRKDIIKRNNVAYNFAFFFHHCIRLEFNGLSLLLGGFDSDFST